MSALAPARRNRSTADGRTTAARARATRATTAAARPGRPSLDFTPRLHGRSHGFGAVPRLARNLEGADQTVAIQISVGNRAVSGLAGGIAAFERKAVRVRRDVRHVEEAPARVIPGARRIGDRSAPRHLRRRETD